MENSAQYAYKTSFMRCPIGSDTVSIGRLIGCSIFPGRARQPSLPCVNFYGGTKQGKCLKMKILFREQGQNNSPKQSCEAGVAPGGFYPCLKIDLLSILKIVVGLAQLRVMYYRDGYGRRITWLLFHAYQANTPGEPQCYLNTRKGKRVCYIHLYTPGP